MIDNGLTAAIASWLARTHKSTAIAPLSVPFLALLTAIAIVARTGPVVLLFVLVGMAGILLIAMLVAYFYFMVKNPDALRTEGYSLRKFEMGIIGDTKTGLLEDRRSETRMVVRGAVTGEGAEALPPAAKIEGPNEN